jgi:dTDP-4-dehydrorhamnose reductase
LKNILITGVSGYIAPYLAKALVLSGGSKVTGLYNSHPLNIDNVEMLKCDLTDISAVKKVFDIVKPDTVYHLASVTPTRITTQEDKYIESFNSGVTEEIAKLCETAKALMIYTSTDLVYKEGSNILESSALDPLTIYAKTKLMGENAVKKFAGKYFILRTSLVYGFTFSSYTSFFDLTYRALKKGNSIDAFTDQFRNPLYAEDAAAILMQLPGMYSANDIINFCGSEYLSRYEMCIMMADAFGFDRKLIKEASCRNFTKYRMIEQLGLNYDKLTKYGLNTGSFRDSLEKSKKYL